ncbi:hypothetical protein [Flavobacterium sp.]|uniref:hypothetical protein n=1 Tax=Flavobacterium sp. TaxID=239 RepID=UPI00374CFE0F
MSKFSEQVHITIDGFTQTVIYYDLELSQAMMDHHHFSFVWQYTGQAVIKPADQAKALRAYKGMEVIFTFKSLNGGIRLMSKGFITGLKSIDIHGSPVGLHVKGTSHTNLLDDLAKSRTFLDRSLQEIAVKIFSEETAGEFYQIDAIKPTNTKFRETRNHTRDEHTVAELLDEILRTRMTNFVSNLVIVILSFRSFAKPDRF